MIISLAVASSQLSDARYAVVAAIFALTSILIPILYRSHSFPQRLRPLKSRLRAAQSAAANSPVFSRALDDAILQLSDTLDQLGRLAITFEVTQVPSLSFFAMELVDAECTLVYVYYDDDDFIANPHDARALRYFTHFEKAARRIKSTDPAAPARRLFVLTHPHDLSPDLYRFMLRHFNNSIDIRILLGDNPVFSKEKYARLQQDFGYYKTTDGAAWVMFYKKNPDGRSATVRVIGEPSTVGLYREFATAIHESGMTLGQLNDSLREPHNAAAWEEYFGKHGFTLRPPHGLSSEDAEAIVTEAVGTRINKEKPGLRSLVLGRTPALLDACIAAGLRSVHSLDNCDAQPKEFSSTVKFFTGNWLNPDSIPADKYDIIVADEALSNVSTLQLSSFFNDLKQWLLPQGRVVMRVMARYDSDADQYIYKTRMAVQTLLLDIDREMCLDRIGDVDQHAAVSPYIIALAHSSEISYNKLTSEIDCGKWNAFVQQLYDEGAIDSLALRRWRLGFTFRLTSPPLVVLQREAKEAGLIMGPPIEVKGDYARRPLPTKSFFRIVRFEPKS